MSSSLTTFIVGSRQRYESYCRERQISPARHVTSERDLYGHRGGKLLVLGDADPDLATRLIAYAKTHEIEVI